MTLTAIIPSLRTSIPDPLDVDLWPELTTATTTDVIVAGVSLRRLVEVCDTPCVHIAAGVVPGTGGRPAPGRQTTAIVVTVTGVSVGADGAREVRIDACLDAVPAVWAEMRLIGRASCIRSRAALVRADDACAAATPCRTAAIAVLPEDLRAGDLLAIPCPDGVVLRNLRPVAAAGATPATSVVGRPSWLRGLD